MDEHAMRKVLAAAGVSPESPTAKAARNTVELSSFMAREAAISAMYKLGMDATDKEQVDRFVATLGARPMHYCEQQLLARLRQVMMEEADHATRYFTTVYTGMQIHGDLDRVVQDVLSNAFRDMAGGTEGEQD